jgi:hypothetical protein
LADQLCQPVKDERGRRRRALNPFSPEDANLLAAVIHGEHVLTKEGRIAITAFLAARNATLDQLTKVA